MTRYQLTAEETRLSPDIRRQMVIIVLRAKHVAEHAVGLAKRLSHELLHGPAEFFGALHADQPSVDYFTIVVLPVVAALVLLPVPPAHTLAMKTLKNEDLATLLVLNEHADMVELAARDTPDNAVLHGLSSKE